MPLLEGFVSVAGGFEVGGNALLVELGVGVVHQGVAQALAPPVAADDQEQQAPVRFRAWWVSIWASRCWNRDRFSPASSASCRG
jgi:hypothetical protein